MELNHNTVPAWEDTKGRERGKTRQLIRHNSTWRHRLYIFQYGNISGNLTQPDGWGGCCYKGGEGACLHWLVKVCLLVWLLIFFTCLLGCLFVGVFVCGLVGFFVCWLGCWGCLCVGVFVCLFVLRNAVLVSIHFFASIRLKLKWYTSHSRADEGLGILHRLTQKKMLKSAGGMQSVITNSAGSLNKYQNKNTQGTIDNGPNYTSWVISPKG